MAWLRSSDDAGIIGAVMPARRRCAALASTTCAPVRVQIGLGRDDRCDRADLEGLPDERHLGFGELLAGVADHQHRVGVGQQAQRRRQVRLAVTADTRGVDERQSALEQRAGRGHLDAQHLAATGLRGAAQVVAQMSAMGISISSGSVAVGPRAPPAAPRPARRRTPPWPAPSISSSPTRATGMFSSELSSWLLPCLSWPAITTRICGSLIRSLARASRSTRSPRSLRSAILRGVVDQLDDHLDLAGVSFGCVMVLLCSSGGELER